MSGIKLVPSIQSITAWISLTTIDALRSARDIFPKFDNWIPLFSVFSKILIFYIGDSIPCYLTILWIKFHAYELVS